MKFKIEEIRAYLSQKMKVQKYNYSLEAIVQNQFCYDSTLKLIGDHFEINLNKTTDFGQ